MTPTPRDNNPAHKVLAVLGTFIGTAAVSALLWNWWAPRCGDDCPTPSIVHMLVFLALLPTLGTMGAVLLVSTSWPRRTKLGIAAVLLLVATGVALLLARVPAA